MADVITEVYNDNGSLQFGINSQIPFVVAQGTHSTGTNTRASNQPGWTGTFVDVDGLTSQAFIAVTLNNSRPIAFQYVERIGSVNRYHFYALNPAFDFDWYAYDLPPITPATSGVVFEAYTETGQLLWSLKSKMAVCAGFIFQPINAGSLGGSSINIPNGRRYAIAFGMRSGYGRFDSIGAPDGSADRYSYRYLLDCVSYSGSTLTVAPQIVDRSNGFTTDPQYANYRDYFSPRNNMILDITNF